MVPLPPQRALHTTDNGVVDAVLARVGGTEKKYKNLIPVPFVIYKVSLHFVSAHSIDYSGDINKLKDKSMCTIHGVLAFNRITKKIPNVMHATTFSSAFNNVAKGRCDLTLSTKATFDLLTKRNPKVFKSLKLLSPPTIRAKMYHYVNIKNKHLIPKLLNVFKKMKTEGKCKQIEAEVDRELSL
jgi:ABC-type amino acid transport substrate-binding protein